MPHISNPRTIRASVLTPPKPSKNFSASGETGLHRIKDTLNALALGSLAPLLDRPQPIGFVLVGIVSGRRRYQPRAFLAEVFETTP